MKTCWLEIHVDENFQLVTRLLPEAAKNGVAETGTSVNVLQCKVIPIGRNNGVQNNRFHNNGVHNNG